MLEIGLDEALKRFLIAENSAEKNAIFKAILYPFLEDIINGVFLSLNIAGLCYQNKEDIKQHVYLTVLINVNIEKINGIRSVKNYFFITVKNITVDYLRHENWRRKFNQKIEYLINNVGNE